MKQLGELLVGFLVLWLGAFCIASGVCINDIWSDLNSHKKHGVL